MDAGIFIHNININQFIFQVFFSPQKTILVVSYFFPYSLDSGNHLTHHLHFLLWYPKRLLEFVSFSSRKQLLVCQIVRLKYQSFLDILRGGLYESGQVLELLTLCFSLLALMAAMLLSIWSRSNYLHIKIITQLCNKMMALNNRLKIDLILMQEQHSEAEKHIHV